MTSYEKLKKKNQAMEGIIRLVRDKLIYCHLNIPVVEESIKILDEALNLK